MSSVMIPLATVTQDTVQAIKEFTPEQMANLLKVTKASGWQGAFGCAAAALGVGFVGSKAVESVGRNPAASGKILVQSILGMALAEAVAFYALFL